MAKNLDISDAIFGLIWCMASVDTKVDPIEIKYLQYLKEEKKINLTKNVILQKNGTLSFYGKKGIKEAKSIWEMCCNRLNASEHLHRTKAIAEIFDFVYIFESFPKYKDLQKKIKKPESTLLFNTLEKLDISEEIIEQLSNRIDPHLICAMSGVELHSKLLTLPKMTKKKVNQVMKHYNNSYEIRKSSVRSLCKIDFIDVEDAVEIHKCFLAL